jgi:hypothetical protein
MHPGWKVRKAILPVIRCVHQIGEAEALCNRMRCLFV